MGSPNATVCRLRGVGLILDGLARGGCCGGATKVPLVRAGGRPTGADAGGEGEGAGRPATDTGRERTAQRQRQQATRIQSCSLLGVIKVVGARLGRLLQSLREMWSLPLDRTDVIVVVRRG
jgi:hypothetical protein